MSNPDRITPCTATMRATLTRNFELEGFGCRGELGGMIGFEVLMSFEG
jgi:hypothetical protein